MSGLSNYAENEILDHIAGTAWTAPTSLHLKLHVGDPGEDCTGNASAETSRQTITFATASGGSMASSNGQSWTSWSAGTETISYVSIWDNSTAGNAIGYGTVTSPPTVNNGDTLTFSTGNITFALA